MNIKLSKSEKQIRHGIYRSFIAGVRAEQPAKESKKLSDYAEMIFLIPNLKSSKNFGALSEDEIHKLGICKIPNSILNSTVCEKVASKVRGDLSVASGFRRYGESWRLDIDEKFSKQGLLLPLRDNKNFIYGFMAYRYPDDPRPFFVKARMG